MPADELARELAAGVVFWGAARDGRLVGVMGLQAVDDVELIRHAYVAPGEQGRGTGSALLTHLRGLSRRPILVGTWAAADWAVRFYQRHGFGLLEPGRTPQVLSRYWTISQRQVETSVVLADPPL
jgi:GNAT superfamily N-acetyltransferase